MKNKQYMPMSYKQQMKVHKIHHDSVKKKREDNIVSASFNVTLLLSAWALHDKFGFGTKRIEHWVDEVNNLLDSYNKGYVSISDLNTTMKEETGIEFIQSQNLKDENYQYK